MEEDDDLIVVVVNEQGGQDHEIYLDPGVNVKVEPAEITEIDETQQKELMNLISSGCSGYIKPEVESLDEEDYDVEYLPEEFTDDEANNEEIDESDETDDDNFLKGKKSNLTKPVGKKKGPNSMNNSATWVSYVNNIRLDHPEEADNDEAMIELIVDEMKSIEIPVNDGSWHTFIGVDQYQCNVCTTIKCTVSEVTKHYLNQHGPRYLVCLACGADFRSTTNLYKHEKRCMAPDASLVLKARAKYIGNKARCGPHKTGNKARYGPHNIIAGRVAGKHKYSNEDKRFFCTLCPATYMAKTSLIAHERLHRAERPYKCNSCDRSYTCKAVLAKHKMVHEDGAFACDYCGRTFKYKTALTSHIYSHSDVPRFPCRECDRRFTYKAALQLHVHSKHRHMPPPCACKICPKRFARMWALKDHMKKAHGLLIMTRRMFFKQLPTMSETCIKEARVVLRSEVPILHPSDINIEPPTKRKLNNGQVNQKHTEPFLDEKSGKIVSKSEQEHHPQLYKKVEVKEEACSNSEMANGDQEQIVEIENENVEMNEIIEIQEVPVTEDSEENYLRIVLLDDSVVDYTELVNNYHMSGNKNSNIVVIENGKVKEISDEELKTYEESINGIQL